MIGAADFFLTLVLVQ